MARAGEVVVVHARFPRAARADKLRAMPARIEDYALVGDLQSAALISADGAVDWLGLPRFDSPACFAALLGEAEHGCWRMAPAGVVTARSRRYRPGTLVLETEFETADGAVRVIDFMPRLLAEEYDVDRRRQVGNFPQAFSHLALIQAAQAITTAGAVQEPPGSSPVGEPAPARRPA
jgi:GH15 family glucan-1,4-alpha-glucosidase